MTRGYDPTMGDDGPPGSGCAGMIFGIMAMVGVVLLFLLAG